MARDRTSPTGGDATRFVTSGPVLDVQAGRSDASSANAQGSTYCIRQKFRLIWHDARLGEVLGARVDVLEQLIEAWRTNGRINDLLIDEISREGMKATLSKRGGRNVVRQFTHMHNNRIWQLEGRAKDLVKGLHKFATKDEPTKRTLKKNLRESGEAIEQFLERCVEGAAKTRGFKKGPVAYLSYLVSHESHHRGNILLTLKESGYKVDKSVAYKIWDWDRV